MTINIGTQTSEIWSVRTDKDYPAAPTGSYFFMAGSRPGAEVAGRYWFYDKDDDSVKQYGFESPETNYTIYDVRSFLDVGGGHFFVACRIEHDTLPNTTRGIILESEDYGVTWETRYSPSVGWNDVSYTDEAVDIRDLTLSSDGLVYAAFSSTSDAPGILRFAHSSSVAPDYCLITGLFSGATAKNYAICQDSASKWYAYCVKISSTTYPVIARIDAFENSGSKAGTVIWTSSQTFAADDEKIVNQYVRKLEYSSDSDTIWIGTADNLWTYNVAGASTSEYLVTTDFETDFSITDVNLIEIDSTGAPEYLIGGVDVRDPGDEGSGGQYVCILKRTTGNAFDAFLFSESDTYSAYAYYGFQLKTFTSSQTDSPGTYIVTDRGFFNETTDTVVQDDETWGIIEQITDLGDELNQAVGVTTIAKSVYDSV